MTLSVEYGTFLFLFKSNHSLKWFTFAMLTVLTCHLMTSIKALPLAIITSLIITAENDFCFKIRIKMVFVAVFFYGFFFRHRVNVRYVKPMLQTRLIRSDVTKSMRWQLQTMRTNKISEKIQPKNLWSRH